MKNKKMIIALIMTACMTLKMSSIVYAEPLENTNEENPSLGITDEVNKNMSKEEQEFIQPFRLEFNENIENITSQGSITLDGNMSDWSGIPYINDVDKYGVHGEDITGASYYIDESNN
ncbi:MAG: hypothetical protein ACRDA5_10810, partial [Clostridium sp.]